MSAHLIKVAVESGQPVVWMSENNYMFRLSAFRDRLLDWYRANPECMYALDAVNL
jgi:methionyl-tRNA synthetase